MTDFMEADSMLAECIEAWFEEATQKGIQKGFQTGIQQGIEKGIEEGLVQGRVQGRHEGEVRLLARLLRRRFDPLPASVAERLLQASEDELQAWGEAVLNAPTLAAVFDEVRH